MAEISTQVFKDEDLTVFTVLGDVQPGELLAYLEKEHLDLERPRRVLWDMSQASWAAITIETLTSNLAKSIRHTRPGFKTAYVMGSQSDYGMGRIMESHSESSGAGVYRPFKSLEQARSWLVSEEA